jgi:DNA-binding FadR family transcriptional regulator
MKPVRKIAIHEMVVNQLRQAIHLGDYLPGDRLPAERDIADRLEVSRETVRGAIQVLEDEGYVVRRRGAAGGHAITALKEPTARMLAQLRADQDSIVNLMDFRRANECLAARLAAEHASSTAIEKIARAVDDLKTAEDIPRFRRADASFHLAVAVAAGNPYVVEAITDARDAIFLLHGKRDYKLVLDTTLSGHQEILEAIRAREPDRAEQAMARHIDVALDEIRHALNTVAEK